MLNRTKIFFSTMLVINIIMSFIKFFSIYFLNIYLYAPGIILIFFIILIIIDLIIIILTIIKTKKMYYFTILIIPIITLFLGLTSINVKMIFKLELIKSKIKLEKILKNNLNYENFNNVYYDKNIYLFTFIKTKNAWWLHAYDNENYLEKINKKINGGMQENENIIIMGYKLNFIKLVEQKWYFCILNEKE